jgi:hypothetical protein
MDACVAEQTKARKECEFTNSYHQEYETTKGYVDADEVESAVWRIVRHPAVNLPGGLAVGEGGRFILTGQVTVPGELRLAATGRTLDGERITFNQTCLVSDTQLAAWIKTDGTMATVWKPRPDDGKIPQIPLKCY